MAIPAAIVTAAQDQESESAWVWLWKITVDISTIATSVVYLTRQAQPVTFDGDEYLPYDMSHDRVDEDSSGRATALNLTMSNVGRQISSFVETGQGLSNMPVVLTLVRMDMLGTGFARQFDLTIETVSVGISTANLSLETPDFFRAVSPRDTFGRDRCSNRFKGKRCGYVGTLLVCDKSLPCCISIGADEAASGLTVQHPKRFRAFPGIQRGLSG